LRRSKRILSSAAVFVNNYTVEVKPPVKKELEALPDKVLARVVRKLESLPDNPRPTGCKKLKGYKDQWRIRVSDWRWFTSLTTARNWSV
jgi:mRNA-degrading endonuclease RelE of RelBE toxin-antitoxin system